MAQRDSSVRDAGVDADRALLEAIARRSPESLGDLYDRHAAVVYGLAKRIVRRAEDAEEVVQDVFAQVWRDAPRYDPSRASVAGWLVMLAKTRAIDRLRASRARPDLDAGSEEGPAWVPSHDPSPEHQAVSADEARGIEDALVTLPETQRTLVDLAYFEGLTQSEIAGRTGVPLGTVKTRLRAAMAALRSVMSP